MTTTYENFLGDPVDLFAHDTKKPKAKRAFVPSHSGWVVKGASPDIYAQQCIIRQAEIRKIKEANKKQGAKQVAVPNELPPFSEWAKSNRQKANPKPCSSIGVALEYKAQAEKAGWLHVEIIELKKGDISQLKGVMPI